ncbi:hypothetical protein HHK36_008652 [Tetracentron sinense]|uniref:F-box domain-containing protein n=1 Tax=Tetracentron sinense TaxID=13715 RepID=A0A835DNJ3_TETSI|nr:hypothetical protein HHK36_008652 [Tetracentron sinense]
MPLHLRRIPPHLHLDDRLRHRLRTWCFSGSRGSLPRRPRAANTGFLSFLRGVTSSTAVVASAIAVRICFGNSGQIIGLNNRRRRWLSDRDAEAEEVVKDHGDLLELIMGSLSLADQTRFRAACKSWRSIGQRTYTVNTLFNVKEKKNLHVLSSKHGWLFLSTGFSIFLYCPFTKKRINLPDSNTRFDIATFSSTPTSPDCVFFCVFHMPYSHIKICTCGRGEETWSTHIFHIGIPTIDKVVYSQGIFYCVNGWGALWAFNVATKDWNKLKKPMGVLVFWYEIGTYIVESKGDILMVILNSLVLWNPIFKLDRSSMAWVKVDSLGDQALFLDCSSLFSILAPRGTEGIEEVRGGFLRIGTEDDGVTEDDGDKDEKEKMVIRWRCRSGRGGKRPWSDLPNDLLELIMGSLSFMDQTRFRAVCKSWRMIGNFRPSNQLPWLLAFTNDSWNQYKLVDPSSKRTYTVNTLFNVKEKKNLHALSSKHGWLFLSTGFSFFLYCPFTKKRINLTDSDTHFDISTFSSTPTSPDCVFFCVFHMPYSHIKISPCRRGEETWSTHIFHPTIDKVVYSQGIYYCVNGWGALWTFNVATKDWSIEEVRGRFLRIGTDDDSVIEDDGDKDEVAVVSIFLGISWYFSYESVVEATEEQLSWVLIATPIVLLLAVRWLSSIENSEDLFAISPSDRHRRTHHRPSDGSSPWSVAALIVLLLIMPAYWESDKKRMMMAKMASKGSGGAEMEARRKMLAGEEKAVKKEELDVEEEDEDESSLSSLLKDKKKKPNASQPQARAKLAKVKKEEPKDEVDDKPAIKKDLKKAKKNGKKKERKVFDLPGQKRDPPEERDPLRVFYETLYQQVPASEMAAFWMMESGLLSKEEAKKIYEKKLKRSQQQKLNSPIKTITTVKRTKQSVTVKRKTTSPASSAKKKITESKTVSKLSKKRKIEDGDSVNESDDDSVKRKTSSPASSAKKKITESKTVSKLSKKRKIGDGGSDNESDDDFVLAKKKTKKQRAA